MRPYLLYLALCSTLFFSTSSSAQHENVQTNEQHLGAYSLFHHNLTSFTHRDTRRLVNHEVLAMNEGFEHHPELGTVPDPTTCTNCYEMIGKRTERTKTFAALGSNGAHIFIMSANEPINYEKDGEWLTIPKGVRKQSEDIYTVFSTTTPIVVNTEKQFVQIGEGSDQVIFNDRLALVYVDAQGHQRSLGTADWSHYTVGDEGFHIINAWPGIDMTMVLYQGRVKTNFILKQALPQYQSGKLIIKDALKFKDGLHLRAADDNPAVSFTITDAAGNAIYDISPATGYQQKDVLGSMTTLPYEKTDEHTLALTIDGQYLNLKADAYPFVIDPLFSGTNSLGVRTMGAKNGGLADPCSYTNNVPVPDAVTITDLTFSFGYQINLFNTGILASNVSFGLRIDGPGGNSCKAGNWACEDYKNGVPAVQCYTDGVFSVHSFLKDCYPPPQCKSYLLPVILDFYRNKGPVGSCAAMVYAWNYLPFTVVVEGHTLELNGPIVTDLGTYHSCVGDSVDLTANGMYGVPPYSYTWTPGNYNTQTIRVSPNVDQEYTAVITDMCGNQVSAKANIKVDKPSSTEVYDTVCNAAFPYDWNGLNITAAGDHVYTGTNVKGCDSVVTLHVTLIPVEKDTTRISGCSSVVYKGKTYASPTIIQDTIRSVVSGCDSLHRSVIVEIKKTRLWFPNAFSPNGDGINDKFGPELAGAYPNQYRLQVFNRWGGLVFTSFNMNDKWDGLINGKPADMGSYYYYFSGKCADDTPIEQKGAVDLIR